MNLSHILKQYFPDKITKPILNHNFMLKDIYVLNLNLIMIIYLKVQKSFKIQGGLLTNYSIKKFEKTTYAMILLN